MIFLTKGKLQYTWFLLTGSQLQMACVTLVGKRDIQSAVRKILGPHHIISALHWCHNYNYYVSSASCCMTATDIVVRRQLPQPTWHTDYMCVDLCKYKGMLKSLHLTPSYHTTTK